MSKSRNDGPLHVLWTPSWFPSRRQPLNGSFFLEQVTMLEEAGLSVGVINLDPRSFWQLRSFQLEVDSNTRTIRGEIPTIPHGIVRGDGAIIAACVKRAGAQYAHHFGIPDVIHAHSVFPGILVAQTLADMWNIPYGITEHRPSSLTRNPLSFRYRDISRAITQANFRLAVSHDFADKLTRYYGSAPFKVMSLPVPQRFFDHPLKLRRDTFCFVHVSHLDRNKRVEEVIRAFAFVHGRYPHTQLRIIGGDTERVAELTRLAHSCGVRDNVVLTGAIPRDRIAHEMGEGDCLILVSQWEAGGTVYAEAQSLGLSCIASATPGGRFMVTPDVGYVVPIDDVSALVEAMKRIVVSDQSGTGFDPQAIRAKAWRRFSPQVFSAAHQDIYERVIAGECI
ncbi:MAG: glycosyltransferase [Actinomycetaceae bacterium]|nr:glycosyltransferase [Actinomycetaceae bacterium]